MLNGSARPMHHRTSFAVTDMCAAWLCFSADVGQATLGVAKGTLTDKHEHRVNAIVFEPSGHRMYSGDGGGVVVVWEVHNTRSHDVNGYSVWCCVRLAHAEWASLRRSDHWCV